VRLVVILKSLLPELEVAEGQETVKVKQKKRGN